MTDESNLVRKWVKIIQENIDLALNELYGSDYQSATNAQVFIARASGCCDAIIAAVERDDPVEVTGK